MNQSEDTLSAAMKVCDIADNESLYRAAISRFYYSAYYKCREFEDSLGENIGYDASAKKGGMHWLFITRLSNPNNAVSFDRRVLSIALGKELRKIYDRRLLADYRLDKDVSESDMIDAKNIAQVIFDY